jgi:hypothetical protein
MELEFTTHRSDVGDPTVPKDRSIGVREPLAAFLAIEGKAILVGRGRGALSETKDRPSSLQKVHE